jgi:hypothetical protein
MLLCEAEGGQSPILRTNKICIYSRIVKKKYMNSGEVSFFSYTTLRTLRKYRSGSHKEAKSIG